MTEVYRSLGRRLNEIIDLELEKPLDEIDCDLINECADGILRLQNPEKYLISEQKYSSAINKIFRANRIKLSRTAKVILVAAAILLLLASTALGYAQHKYNIFNYGDHGTILTEKQFGVLKEGLTVGYIPEGFTKVSEDKSKYSIAFSYQSGDRIMAIRKSSIYDSIDVDTSYGELREKKIGETIYFMSGNDEIFCIVNWFDNNYNYSVFGQLSEEELLKIAEEVR